MTTKQKTRSPRQIDEVRGSYVVPARSAVNSRSLLLYLLISLVIHGLIALIIAHQERSRLTPNKKQAKTPIEFILVPPEEKSDPPPETKRRAANNSVAEGEVKPKPPTPDKQGDSATDSQTELAPKVASSNSEAKPSLPQQTSPQPAPATSDSKPKPTPPEKQILPQKTEPNPSVATRSSPPQPVPPTPPSTSSNSGAASLLGGSYQRSIAQDSGSSFFNLEANANKEAPYAKLDARQDDLGPYFDEIRRRVKRNWQPVSPGQEQFTVLNFAIQRNGQITGLKVIQTSGNERVDRDALEAVQKSAPFDALPQSFEGDRLEIQFSFNIYIHQGTFSPNLGLPYP